MQERKEDRSITELIRLSTLLHYLFGRSNLGDPANDSQKG